MINIHSVFLISFSFLSDSNIEHRQYLEQYVISRFRVYHFCFYWCCLPWQVWFWLCNMICSFRSCLDKKSLICGTRWWWRCCYFYSISPSGVTVVDLISPESYRFLAMLFFSFSFICVFPSVELKLNIVSCLKHLILLSVFSYTPNHDNRYKTEYSQHCPNKRMLKNIDYICNCHKRWYLMIINHILYQVNKACTWLLVFG